jgi:ATP-dependent DNA helicase RecG
MRRSESEREDHRKSSRKSSGKTEERIIRLLSVNGKLTIPELADTLGITTRAVEKQIAGLRGQGRLRRVGPAKGGRWEVVK